MSHGQSISANGIKGPSARRWVAHVDMDAFFASVEQLDDPTLLGKPLIVGNSPLTMERLRELAAEAQKLPHVPEFIKGIRGVVASASYEARAFGVRSAMPLAKALALCPEAHVLPGRFDRYRDVARMLHQVWSEFSPVVEPMSLDEAYLDLTGIELTDGPIEGVGTKLKARIREATGLTASVGIAPNKLVAKIASDLRKPDGLVIVAHGRASELFAPLRVRALPGVGPRTAEALETLGIKTLGQLASARETVLAASFGLDHARSLIPPRRRRGRHPRANTGHPQIYQQGRNTCRRRNRPPQPQINSERSVRQRRVDPQGRRLPHSLRLYQAAPSPHAACLATRGTGVR